MTRTTIASLIALAATLTLVVASTPARAQHGMKPGPGEAKPNDFEVDLIE